MRARDALGLSPPRLIGRGEEAAGVLSKITFHRLIDEPGGKGRTGRWFKRSDGVNVGMIRLAGEDAYTSEARRHGVGDWTVSLMPLRDVELDRREHLVLDARQGRSR